MNGPTEPAGAPLGRYAPTATEGLVPVELRRLPVLVLLAAPPAPLLQQAPRSHAPVQQPQPLAPTQQHRSK